jgi:hypothetical protein
MVAANTTDDRILAIPSAAGRRVTRLLMLKGGKDSRGRAVAVIFGGAVVGWPQTLGGGASDAMRGCQMELEHNLRSVSDEMLRTLEQLQRLENQKRSESPGTPRFVRLATEIEKLAAMVFAQTSTQQSLAEQSHEAGLRGAELAPINEIEATRDVAVVLSEWREAERRLAASAVDSADHAKAAGDVRRLRDEYHRAHRAQGGAAEGRATDS